MSVQKEKKTVTEQLQVELAEWQTKLDDAKVQMHLGVKEAQVKIQPHVERLDQDLSRAKEQLEQLKNSSGGAWDDLKSGLKTSFKTMHTSFEKAKQHFSD